MQEQTGTLLTTYSYDGNDNCTLMNQMGTLPNEGTDTLMNLEHLDTSELAFPVVLTRWPLAAQEQRPELVVVGNANALTTATDPTWLKGLLLVDKKAHAYHVGEAKKLKRSRPELPGVAGFIFHLIFPTCEVEVLYEGDDFTMGVEELKHLVLIALEHPVLSELWDEGDRDVRQIRRRVGAAQSVSDVISPLQFRMYK